MNTIMQKSKTQRIIDWFAANPDKHLQFKKVWNHSSIAKYLSVYKTEHSALILAKDLKTHLDCPLYEQFLDEYHFSVLLKKQKEISNVQINKFKIKHWLDLHPLTQRKIQYDFNIDSIDSYLSTIKYNETLLFFTKDLRSYGCQLYQELFNEVKAPTYNFSN